MTTENENVGGEANVQGDAPANVGKACVYEIIDKVTGETFPVSHDGSGDLDNDQDADFFCKKEDGTEVVFTRNGSTENGDAIFENAQYVIRDVETKLALDGVTPVADVVPASSDEGTGEGEGETKSDEGSDNAVDTEVAEFHVYDAAGIFVRTYSLADHGDNAKEIAEQFAAKIGGSVK